MSGVLDSTSAGFHLFLLRIYGMIPKKKQERTSEPDNNDKMLEEAVKILENSSLENIIEEGEPEETE